MTIYTLIVTAVFSHGAVHSEHDYPTRAACQAAFSIAQKQLERYQVDIAGTCLAVEKASGAGQ